MAAFGLTGRRIGRKGLDFCARRVYDRIRGRGLWMMTNDVGNKLKDPVWVMDMMTLCREVRYEMEAAMGKLDSAKNWGWFDIFGGGFLSTMIKHHRINGAKGHIEAARGRLFRLRRELDHANLGSVMGKGPGGFASIADHLFDGMIADLYVQGKINELRNDVRRVLGELDRVERFLTSGR